MGQQLRGCAASPLALTGDAGEGALALCLQGLGEGEQAPGEGVLLAKVGVPSAVGLGGVGGGGNQSCLAGRSGQTWVLECSSPWSSPLSRAFFQVEADGVHTAG